MTVPSSTAAADGKSGRNVLARIGAKLRSRAGNDQLVAVVILICVVIGLCTVFRNQIYDLFTNTIFPGLQGAAQGFLDFSGN